MKEDKKKYKGINRERSGLGSLGSGERRERERSLVGRRIKESLCREFGQRMNEWMDE